MSYRRDNRSLKQFRKDIKNGTETEKEILERWLTAQDVTHDAYSDTGCCNKGEYLQDHQVNMDADFHVEGIGRLEIKFSRPMVDRLHLKCSQVKSYLKQDAAILLVNGWETDSPVYTIIRPQVLQAKSEKWESGPFKGFGYKRAYRLYVSEFIWREF